MSRPEPRFYPLLERLRDHLRQQRYSWSVTQSYPVAIRRFLRDLERRGRRIETLTSTDVEGYLDALRLKRRCGVIPNHSRRMHRAAIRMLLRLERGEWPPKVAPTAAHEIAQLETVAAYELWMTERRGLSAETRRTARAEAHRLLQWLREKHITPATLCVADLDRYVALRGAAMRRTSITLLVSTLRGVLRHLHRSGKMPVDLAGTLRGPPMYALERIPSTISTPDVERVLQAAQHDHSLLGRRDYAIVMLLATYGLRASEITQLRLSDVDWRHERLHIRHSKTGAHSDLPLLRAPADAIIKYLRHARPVTKERAIFIRASAPDRALRSSSAVHAVVTRRLAAAGVVTTGKHGAHLLRHSRAVSLLRGGVALNVIGAVLGHRSARATAVYLKLATEDLRLVALEVPAQVAP